MRVQIHPRVAQRHPNISPEDVTTAFEGTLTCRARATSPIQWVGIGVDHQGRLLEYIAVENEPDGWLIFHAMVATRKVLQELGIGGK